MQRIVHRYVRLFLDVGGTTPSWTGASVADEVVDGRTEAPDPRKGKSQ
jgi:hypothetical protein